MTKDEKDGNWPFKGMYGIWSDTSPSDIKESGSSYGGGTVIALLMISNCFWRLIIHMVRNKPLLDILLRLSNIFHTPKIIKTVEVQLRNKFISSYILLFSLFKYFLLPSEEENIFFFGGENIFTFSSSEENSFQDQFQWIRSKIILRCKARRSQ